MWIERFINNQYGDQNHLSRNGSLLQAKQISDLYFSGAAR
jgi:hypothetical protein